MGTSAVIRTYKPELIMFASFKKVHIKYVFLSICSTFDIFDTSQI